jgi:glutamate racemase
LLQTKIEAYLPDHIQVVSQGDIVAQSLQNYLYRHPEMEMKLSENATHQFFTTTDDTLDFDQNATMFFSGKVTSAYVPVK